MHVQASCWLAADFFLPKRPRLLQNGRPANVAEDLIMGGVAGAAAAAATTPLDVVKTVSGAHCCCSLSLAGSTSQACLRHTVGTPTCTALLAVQATDLRFMFHSS